MGNYRSKEFEAEIFDELITGDRKKIFEMRNKYLVSMKIIHIFFFYTIFVFSAFSLYYT
jgi:hypothetical protein